MGGPVGKVSQRAGHLVQRPDATQIGKPRQQGDAALGTAQPRRQIWQGAISKAVQFLSTRKGRIAGQGHF